MEFQKSENRLLNKIPNVFISQKTVISSLSKTHVLFILHFVKTAKMSMCLHRHFFRFQEIDKIIKGIFPLG